MDHPRRPRTLIILLFILVAMTFLVGTLRLFGPAQAAAVLEDTSQTDRQPGEALAPTFTITVNFSIPVPTFTAPPASLLPPPTEVATSMPTPAPPLTPTVTPVPQPEIYITDMTGIVLLAIILVLVILVGITWGGRASRKKKG